MSDDTVIGLAFCLPILVLWLAVIARGNRRRDRRTLTRVDYARCERAGSQASFARRLRSGRTW